MSYSLINLCWRCKKEEKCTDKQDIQEAINKIHSKDQESGHLGAGTITLYCQYIETENKTDGN